jgi:hypothetical protein
MEKSSQTAWIVPLRHFFPLKVVPLIEVLLYFEKESSKKSGVFTSMEAMAYSLVPFLSFNKAWPSMETIGTVQVFYPMITAP